MDHQKRKLANKDASAAEKGKVVSLEVKLEPNMNGITEGTAGRECAGCCVCRPHVYSQRKLVRANLVTR